MAEFGDKFCQIWEDEDLEDEQVILVGATGNELFNGSLADFSDWVEKNGDLWTEQTMLVVSPSDYDHFIRECSVMSVQ